MHLDLDTTLICDDGTEVRLADVVIDPRTRYVTHVVVHPVRGGSPHRLVPLDLVEHDRDGRVRLHVSPSVLAELPAIGETDLLRLAEQPIAGPGWAVGIQEVLALPHFDAEFGEGWFDERTAISWDRIPAGEVEIRRQSVVVSAAGHEIGHVDGFVCDADGAITHLVLQHGHLFGARDVAIPIGNVRRLGTDRIRVNLCRDAIRQLPPVTVHRHHRRHDASHQHQRSQHDRSHGDPS